MGKSNKDQGKSEELVSDLNQAFRKARIEHENEFGRVRSKSWDEIPSHRQKRRCVKQSLNQFLDNPEDFEDFE